MLRKYAILLDPNAGGDGSDKPFVPPKTFKPASITPKPEYKEPPKEVLERKDFSLEDAPTFKDSDVRITKVDERTGKETPLHTEPANEPKSKVEDDKKVIQDKEQQEKVDDKGGKKEEVSTIFKPPVKVEEKKEEKKDDKGNVVQIVPPAKKERDYTGFSAEETAHLKQMSNEAFEFTSKLIKDAKNKPQSNGNGEHWFQDPQAFRLSPQYQQAQVNSVILRGESDFWTEQLLECVAGRPFHDLVGFDKNTGRPIKSKEQIQPSEAMAEKLRKMSTAADNELRNVQGQLAGIEQQYSNRVTTDLQMINSERAKRFKWAEDPQYLEWTVATQDGDKSVKAIREDVIGLFPPYLRNSPGVQVAADMMVALVIRDGELREARNGQKVAEVKADEVRRAEPSSVVKPAPDNNPPALGKVKEFSTTGMPSMNG